MADEAEPTVTGVMVTNGSNQGRLLVAGRTYELPKAYATEMLKVGAVRKPENDQEKVPTVQQFDRPVYYTPPEETPEAEADPEGSDSKSQTVSAGGAKT